MDNSLTVNQLLLFCKEEIKKGNGNKLIMLSNDEEGTGYHFCGYAFTEAKEILPDECISILSDIILLG